MDWTMQHGYPNGFDIGPFMQPVANSIFYPASSVDRSGLQQSNGQLPGLAGRGYAPQIPGGGPWHANGQGNIVVNRYAAPNTAPVTDQTPAPNASTPHSENTAATNHDWEELSPMDRAAELRKRLMASLNRNAKLGVKADSADGTAAKPTVISTTSKSSAVPSLDAAALATAAAAEAEEAVASKAVGSAVEDVEGPGALADVDALLAEGRAAAEAVNKPVNPESSPGEDVTANEKATVVTSVMRDRSESLEQGEIREDSLLRQALEPIGKKEEGIRGRKEAGPAPTSNPPVKADLPKSERRPNGQADPLWRKPAFPAVNGVMPKPVNAPKPNDRPRQDYKTQRTQLQHQQQQQPTFAPNEKTVAKPEVAAAAAVRNPVPSEALQYRPERVSDQAIVGPLAAAPNKTMAVTPAPRFRYPGENEATRTSQAAHHSRYFDDLDEWLELTGYHDQGYRKRAVRRHRALRDIDLERQRIEEEIRLEDERGPFTTRSGMGRRSFAPGYLPAGEGAHRAKRGLSPERGYDEYQHRRKMARVHGAERETVPGSQRTQDEPAMPEAGSSTYNPSTFINREPERSASPRREMIAGRDDGSGEGGALASEPARRQRPPSPRDSTWRRVSVPQPQWRRHSASQDPASQDAGETGFRLPWSADRSGSQARHRREDGASYGYPASHINGNGYGIGTGTGTGFGNGTGTGFGNGNGNGNSNGTGFGTGNGYDYGSWSEGRDFHRPPPRRRRRDGEHEHDHEHDDDNYDDYDGYGYGADRLDERAGRLYRPFRAYNGFRPAGDQWDGGAASPEHYYPNRRFTDFEHGRGSYRDRGRYIRGSASRGAWSGRANGDGGIGGARGTADVGGLAKGPGLADMNCP